MTRHWPAPQVWTIGPSLLGLLFACSGAVASSPRPTDTGGAGGGGTVPGTSGSNSFGGSNAYGGSNSSGGTTPVLNGGSDPGGTNGGFGRRPAVDTCEGKRPLSNEPGQSCSEEGFACYYQWELPLNVQNYFTSYTCCCGTWQTQTANSPSQSYTCAELSPFDPTFPADCGQAGAGGADGAGGEGGSSGAGGDASSGGAAGAH